MERIKHTLCLLVLAAGSLLFNACKKDEVKAQTDVVYELTAEGNVVTFKMVTQGVASYQWDFGDGQTSTDANPVHTYPGKRTIIQFYWRSFGYPDHCRTFCNRAINSS